MKPRLVIVGGGGHARVVADIIDALDAYEVVGYVCPEGDYHISGLERIGDDRVLAQLYADGTTRAAVAVGDNALRMRIDRELVTLGFERPALIHPSAVISRHAKISSGTVVMPAAAVNSGAVIGAGVIINTGATIDHDCCIGDFVHIAPGCHLAGTVTVGEGTFLGVGTAVIPNRRIGAWSILGAGAAVVADIASRCVAVGIPARVTRTIPEVEA